MVIKISSDMDKIEKEIKILKSILAVPKVDGKESLFLPEVITYSDFTIINSYSKDGKSEPKRKNFGYYIIPKYKMSFHDYIQ